MTGIERMGGKFLASLEGFVGLPFPSFRENPSLGFVETQCSFPLRGVACRAFRLRRVLFPTIQPPARAAQIPIAGKGGGHRERSSSFAAASLYFTYSFTTWFATNPADAAAGSASSSALC